MTRVETLTPERPTVLIVDDNADKLVALESILLPLDVEIVTAQSGREALRRLLGRDFAVVLLDVRMPDMDGFETATLIRERQRSANTPIIFITAFTEEMHVAKGYSLRAVDYIMAPVVPEVLRTKVSVLVELFRATAEVRRHAESLHRRTAQLHQLTVASLAINSADSIDAMIAVATTSAVQILGADVATASAEIDQHRASYAAGPRRNGNAAAAEEGPVAADVRRRNAIVRRVSQNVDGSRQHALGVPFIARSGENIGSIEVARTLGAPFGQEDEDLLVQLAQMTSIAVENTVFSEAREANRLKDEFISAVSHELRTPLNALRSWAWVLRQHQLPADKIGTIAEAIDRSVTAQARIIDDLLDVSRIMTGKMSLCLAPVDFRAIVQTAVDGMASLAEGQDVRIERAIAGDTLHVAGDGDRLQQVVANLVSNGVKFTPAGGRIEIGVAREGAQAVLRVRDTGCGIAAGFLPHVFDRFRQADGSSTRRAGGLGVGLTIVRQLVDMHGGTVTAQSEGEGRGATFTVTLPALDQARTAMPAADAGAEPVVRLGGARVLLVEDDADTRNVMVLVLAQAGAAVTTAGSAPEAMRRLAEEPFDAVLCDIGLPGEDGYSLIRRMRALSDPVRRIPTLAISAFARDRDRERARDAGFDGHLAKPIDPTTLLRTLTELVGERLPAQAVQPAETEGERARIA